MITESLSSSGIADYLQSERNRLDALNRKRVYSCVASQNSHLSSTDFPGGRNHLPDSATISSHRSKRFRLSLPEDDEDCVRGAVMVDSVKTAIWNALNHYAYDDAIFAAERLYAESNTDESAFLLATCLYRAGNKHRAFEILSRCHPEQASPDIRYLFGRICCDLEDYHRAESVLANASDFAKPYTIEDVENFYKPDTVSYALQLLGNVHQKFQRRELAASAMKRALSLNPFQWSTFEGLCRMKENVDTKETFFRMIASKSSQSLDLDNEGHSESPPVSEDVEMAPVDEVVSSTPPVIASTPLKPALVKKSIPKTSERNIVGTVKPRMKAIVEESQRSGSPLHSPISSSFIMSLGSPSLRTPNAPSPPSSNSHLNLSTDGPNGRISVVAKKTKSKPPFRVSVSNSTTESPAAARTRRLSDVSIVSSVVSPQPPLRRSSRIQANKSAVKENNSLNKRQLTEVNLKKNRSIEKLEENIHIKQEMPVDVIEKTENVLTTRNTPVIEPVKPEPAVVRPKRKKETSLSVLTRTVVEPSTSTEAVLSEQDRLTGLVMRSYYRFGEAVQALHNYDIQNAIAKLDNFSSEQQDTPFYWYLKGRLHFEMLEHDKSVRAFAEMRRRDMYYVKGIDYYSVALWHLQKDKDLAVLAKYLIEHHKYAPETYIAYGNLFSLQREHETAIKMFRRALQLSPNYAYALTLLGHEYIALDEMDKAVQCFRMALSADPSHYNGWYGMGLIAYKQEQYASALTSFKKALSVYPSNPIILVNLAVAQHALKQTPEALRTLTAAVNSYPNHPLCRFQKASLLYSMGKLDEAMQDLSRLKDMAPKESLVYFLMGKVSKRTGNTHMALMYFSKAMDLDPKGTNNQIKENFNKLYGGVEDDVVPQRAASGTTSANTTYASEM
ncbi:cell division cycle protein 27 homolog [Paramacrobiotus metropolitanus]|uniref:cell division cycle protein 27 homolog n=1 Tax=Paramacrobiotus metropolitanus TaxID=2943436 RepID=UPI002445F413|nr:cell division cycle protein 27 homolog [Paramacrobiotus metropolitanus]